MRKSMILVLVLACGSAQAEEWVSLGRTDNGTKETFVDVASIQIESGLRRGSSKVVFASHAQSGAGEYSSKWVRYFGYRFAFNCVNKMGRVEGMTGYFDDGTTYIDHYYPKPWQTVPMAPKTNWTTLMEYVCAWKAKVSQEEIKGLG
jgi:hypothetical protein